jgi:hypothetical protein
MTERLTILYAQLAEIQGAVKSQRTDFHDILLLSEDRRDEDDKQEGEGDVHNAAAVVHTETVRRYERMCAAQWADNCRLATEARETYQQLTDHLITSLTRLHRVGFLVETRPPLLKATYEMYTVLLLSIRSITTFAKVTNEAKLSRREALAQIDRIADEVATAAEGAAWMLANLFTDDELAHVGASPHLLPPDVRRPTWRDIRLPSHYPQFLTALADVDRSFVAGGGGAAGGLSAVTTPRGATRSTGAQDIGFSSAHRTTPPPRRRPATDSTMPTEGDVNSSSRTISPRLMSLSTLTTTPQQQQHVRSPHFSRR